MKKVCLVGSFRFYREMLNIQKLLKSAGVNCWVPQPSKYRDPNEPSRFLSSSQTDPKEAVMRDAYECTLRCFQKIDECDIVYLVNKSGYVGKSGLLDLGYAHAKNKALYALEPVDDLAVMSLITSVVSPEQLVEIAKQN